MQKIGRTLYVLVLALWVGGMVLFTFVVTPLIFRSYGRDLAGEIVGKLFPGYFLTNLLLAAAALLLFLIFVSGHTLRSRRFALAFLTTALLANLVIVFKLHPDAVRVKQQVISFERESPDSPARKQFSRLHGVSAVLNLGLLAAGIVLIILEVAANGDKDRRTQGNCAMNE